MGIGDYTDEFGAVKEGIHASIGDRPKPSFSSSLSHFSKRAKFAVRLILSEKEVLTFAILQWVAIGLGYYVWIKILGWIPDEMWNKIGESSSRGISLGDIIFLVWSFICVGITTFPIGLLTAAMGAVNFLKKQGKESTIPACFKMVMSRAWPLWIFSWADGWITVNRILDRLPKKNERRSAAGKALAEAMYYAWKLATMGIMPALVTGRGVMDASKRSVDFVVKKFRDVAVLRVAYSGLCWVVGITGWLGSIAFFVWNPDFTGIHLSESQGIYKFYFWGGVPLLISVGIVMIFLRPIYIISIFDIYADYVKERDENLLLPPPPQGKGGAGSTAVAAAIILFLIIAAIIIFRKELGITRMLSNGW